MKKRHEQKLVIIGIVLLVLFNIPVLLLFNSSKAVVGFPLFYAIILGVWLVATILSFVIIKRYYE